MNQQRLNLYNAARVENPTIMGLDHSLILLITYFWNLVGKHSPFKFEANGYYKKASMTLLQKAWKRYIKGSPVDWLGKLRFLKKNPNVGNDLFIIVLFIILIYLNKNLTVSENVL